MAHYLDQSSDIAFDGEDRWLQILRVPLAHGVDRGDGYTLYEVGAPGYSSSTLPKSTVIQSARFDGDDMVFRVFGRVEQGSYRYKIPDDGPDEFRIRWPVGTKVPRSDVCRMMSERYCVPANHVP